MSGTRRQLDYETPSPPDRTGPPPDGYLGFRAAPTAEDLGPFAGGLSPLVRTLLALIFVSLVLWLILLSAGRYVD